MQPSRKAKERTPDLIADNDNFAFEVECKAQSADEGRKVARSAMHDFCYKLAKSVGHNNIVGVWRDITVRVLDRFSANQDWQNHLVKEIGNVINGGDIRLDDGTGAEVLLRLAPDHRPIIRPREFEHICTLSVRPDGSQPWLTIRCVSMKKDKMLAAIEEDLKDALGQFSGTRPSKIVCYVPEIPSFEGMETLDSGITQMTYHFFKTHQRARNVFEIDYISDIGFDPRQALSAAIHYLRFRNPDFSHDALP